ncbi:PREDICTED: synaptotagmin-6-like [Priapulus caudatus]|uniref:Synaptotagmin-6-like n=1 Tax=Priapulus caudatus TaxID=37621 RepID=A0ABM1ED32_PRICU|nr:PREDICTED: synaptotagmin-6-like [Priapulus caudatus]
MAERRRGELRRDRSYSSGSRQRSESLSESGIGTLDLDLYRRKTDVISQKLDEPSSGLGKLHFRLRYDFDKSDFVIHLIEAHDLPPGDKEGFNDPYVEVRLYKETDSKLRRSSIQRKTLFPVFNDVFKFPITYEELQEKTLHFYVYDFDKFSREDVTGVVKIDMGKVDVSSELEVWSDIQKHKRVHEGAGEILFSLSYLPSADRLTIVIMKGKDLKPAETHQGYGV